MSNSVGAVIGRFQVDNLHEGHRFIINTALKNHRRVIVFIGCAAFVGTKTNPLDYPTRERMIRAEFPDVTVLPLSDVPSDKLWSQSIDSAIRTIVPNVAQATIYGGRDSFVPHYHGTFDAVEVDAGISFLNGSELRSNIGKVVRSSPDFRAGIIYAKQNEFPSVHACVDVAVMRDKQQVATAWHSDDKEHQHPFPIMEKEFLLGRKKGEQRWRFPGGKVDKTDASYEAAARRELLEETGLTIEGKLAFLGSAPIKDYRISPKDSFSHFTCLFGGRYNFGTAAGADDLVETKWFTVAEAENIILEDHRPLLDIVRNS